MKIFKINSDEENELKNSLGVQIIPTIISHKNGEEVGTRLVKPNNKSLIQNAIKSLLA